MAITVGDICTLTSSDVRTQLDSTNGGDLAILVAFVERIQLDMLRTSNWTFLQSAAKKFITQPGITDYWVGATGTGPAGSVDTGLNITNLKRFNEDSVFNRSTFQQLTSSVHRPTDYGLSQADSASKTGQPNVWVENPDTPYLMQLFPAPDNKNTFQPFPVSPICKTSVAGALPNRVYYVNVTFGDALGNQSIAASGPTKIFVPANSVLVVQPPVPGFAASASGVAYDHYNVYAWSAGTNVSDGGNLGTLTLQNVAPIAIATPFTEPTSGLTTTGAAAPSSSTLAPLDGYVIEFKYWQARPVGLSQGSTLLIPDEYKDVIVAGTNWLAAQFLNKQDDATRWNAIYQTGLRTLVRDRNLSPTLDFMKPDSATLSPF